MAVVLLNLIGLVDERPVRGAGSSPDPAHRGPQVCLALWSRLVQAGPGCSRLVQAGPGWSRPVQTGPLAENLSLEPLMRPTAPSQTTTTTPPRPLGNVPRLKGVVMETGPGAGKGGGVGEEETTSLDPLTFNTKSVLIGRAGGGGGRV